MELSKTFPQKQFTDDYVLKAGNLIKERIVFVKDITEKSKYLFENPNYGNDILQKISPTITNVFSEKLLSHIGNLPFNSAQELESNLKQFAENEQVKIGDFMKFMRICIVGELSGPTVPDLMILLGKETVCNRITNCSNSITQ